MSFLATKAAFAARATMQRQVVPAAAASCNAMDRRSMATVAGIQKVGVIGMGLMGHGIAQIAAEKGYEVVAVDANQDQLTKGLGAVSQSLGKVGERLVKKEKMTAAEAESMQAETLARISGATDAAAVHDCDIVVEAIVENMDIKNPLYEMLGKECKSSTIFATNTSSFPVTDMGKASGQPDRMVGLHFFNPVQLMQLVEVVRTEETDPEVFEKAFLFAQSLGKTAVKCKDTPGFIVNRLLVPFLAQGMAMVDRGDATPEDIDLAMRLGAGHPMGPLQLADYVGHDTNQSILKGWHEKYPEEGAFFVPKCLEELNEKGTLGRKSGQGFYKWEGNKIVNN